MQGYSQVFGEYYLTEEEASQAMMRLKSLNPQLSYGVLYYCIEELFRVIRYIPEERTKRVAK